MAISRYNSGMRELDDELDQRWQAAIVFGSCGNQSVIFSRIGGDELRIAPMQADTLREAEDELVSLTDAALRDRLREAQPWQ